MPVLPVNSMKKAVTLNVEVHSNLLAESSSENMAWELWCTVRRASWTFARGTLLVLCISMATVPLLWQCDTVAALPDVIRIGVVYDQSWSSEEVKQLSQALDRANINASDVGEDLPQHGERGRTQARPRTPHLSLAGVRLEPEDIFRSSKKVCGLVEQGVLAVLGSQEAQTALQVRYACARHQVPHVYLHRQEGQERALPMNTLSLTVTPPADELSRAMCDLVKAQGWKHFTVIYEKTDALVRLRGLLQLHRPGGQPSIVSLRPLDETADPRRVLREVAKAGENNIVFDLTTHRLADVLRHAQKVGIINEYHNFIATTLDLHTVDLSDFQNSGTNLSGFVLVKRELWEHDVAGVRDAYSRSGFHPMFHGQRASRKSIRPIKMRLTLWKKGHQRIWWVMIASKDSAWICSEKYPGSWAFTSSCGLSEMAPTAAETPTVIGMAWSVSYSRWAASTRILVVAWWLFSFVLVSSYTANLASFLTRERLRSPIESVEDLAKQTKVLYGCVHSGSTQAFFKHSKHETYERMWNVMKDDLVSSNAEGVERVERGGYAFLMESTSIEYVAQRRCKLTQLRGLLDSKGYGIAMPQGSPFRSVLSATILRLQESGTFQTLKDRWWKVKDPARRCPDDQVASWTDAVSELGLPKVGGVFVVLLAGLGLACLIAFAEFFFKARSSREKRRNASTGASTSGRPVDISGKYLL
ncbi:glutamate receptor ionotropic, kainate 3-like [Rhipicephalus microplus]|uniref:glutamate receptor ionotropic, kainate 3-like n=1 Tax=Rhipicephalus microplus TaxID=6941 RepID=UPI003F6D8368